MAETAKAGSQEAEVIEAVRDALTELDGVRLLPPPALDLEAVQLAIDCSDQSAQCLSEIATRMNAEILILPRLEKSSDALHLYITRFQEGSAPAFAKSTQAGTRLDATLLDAVPSMLRELLAIEEEAQAMDPSLALPPQTEPPIAIEREPDRGVPLGPVLLGGGGLLLITTGVVVGAIASATEDEYASRTIDTPERAKAATVLRENGKDQALAANVLLGTGAAALVGAGVWFVLAGGFDSEYERSQASLRPMLGPGNAGLVLAGSWETAR
jgi:hypothetical protein